MSNLVDIQQQIEKLQKQAEVIKKREYESTVEEILAKMAAFGITMDDLRRRRSLPNSRAQSAAARGKAPRKAKAGKSGVTVAPKYRGPNGEVWSGRGLMPKWLSLLVSQGQSREAFLIKA